MFTKFSEIIRKLTHNEVSEYIIKNEVIKEHKVAGLRDILRTMGRSRLTTRSNGYYFSGGLALLVDTKDGFMPTDRSRTLLRYSKEMRWAISYLQGLSIACFPRVRAFYDILLEGAKLVYSIEGGQKPFPQFGTKRFRSSNIYFDEGEKVNLRDAINERIRTNPAIYVGDTNASSRKIPLDLELAHLDINITWNGRTIQSFSALCGFGQDIVSSFFSIDPDESDDKNRVLKLDPQKMLSNQWLRSALGECVGFESLLKRIDQSGPTSRRGALLLHIFRKRAPDADWYPWTEIVEDLSWNGMSEDEIEKLENDILRNPLGIDDDLFLLDEEIAIRTLRGASGTQGIMDRVKHSFVRVWRD